MVQADDAWSTSGRMINAPPLGTVQVTEFSLSQFPICSAMCVVAARWNYWQCPRCGKAFKWGGDLFFPKNCHYCLRGNPFLSERDSELKTKSSQFVQPGEPTFRFHLLKDQIKGLSIAGITGRIVSISILTLQRETASIT
jgi:hypothetical protein